jgi:hypothetical protein
MKRKKSKTRLLWDGRYKPYYEITYLDEELETEDKEEGISNSALHFWHWFARFLE